jgi:hypothetical protein
MLAGVKNARHPLRAVARKQQRLAAGTACLSYFLERAGHRAMVCYMKMTAFGVAHGVRLACAAAVCWACWCGQATAVLAPQDAQRGLGFLGRLVGEYPAKTGLWDHRLLHRRLHALLGKRFAFFRANMWNTTAVSRQGSLVYVTGTRLPLAGRDSAIFVADIARDTVWVWLMISGQLFEYRERPLAPDLPAEVALFIDNWRAMSRAGGAPAASYQ